MLLLPYRADVNLRRLPLLTIAVALLCIAVYTQQAWSEHRYREALRRFCTEEISRNEIIVASYLSGADRHYCEVLLEIRQAPDARAAIRTLAAEARPIPFYATRQDSVDYIYTTLLDSSQRFERAVPHNLTAALSYEPGTLNLVRMLTAAFAHADALHLIGNLVFFFAFAASVEVIVGYLYFSAFLTASAIGTHLAYAYSTRGDADALPTVGLSGVVMSMMAFLAIVAPTLRIRCFFWLLLFIRTFSVPIIVIAGLYVLQNVYDYANATTDDPVNYVAHISGAALGALLGLVYRFTHRDYLERLLD